MTVLFLMIRITERKAVPIRGVYPDKGRAQGKLCNRSQIVVVNVG